MSTRDVLIRPPNADEREAWNRLWQGYLEFYRASLAAEITATLWQRILDPADEIECRVAVAADGAVVGLVQYFPHPHTWYQGPICYLNDLFVVPEVRGGGIGRQLIEAVVDEARRHGWSEVYWMTHNDNTVARGLYDRITGGSDGFVTYSIPLQT